MDGQEEEFGMRSTDEMAIVQVLGRLDDMKVDIIRQVGTRMDNLEERLSGKIDGMRADMQRSLSRGRISGGGSSRGSPVQDPDRKNRFSLPEISEVEDLDLVAVKDDAWLPAMRITMMYSIMAFTELCPGAKSWVTEKMKKYYGPAFDLLGHGVSGFAMIFFSVIGDDIKSRHTSKLGALWCTMYTNIMVTMMMSVRTTVFKNRQVPEWLQSFGDIHTAYAYIKSVNEAMEIVNILPLQREQSRANKRYRRSQDAESVRTVSMGSSHPLRPLREVAIRAIRSAVLRVLSDGRLKARLHVYKSVLFVAEEVAKYPSREAAREAGFELEFARNLDEAEMDVPDVLSGIWKIPKAVVSGTEEGDKENADALEELATRFPSLRVRLVYMREITGVPRGAQGLSRARGGTSSGAIPAPGVVSTLTQPGTGSAMEAVQPRLDHSQLPAGLTVAHNGTRHYFKDEEEFSLHTVALGLFVETFMMKEWPVVLKSSQNSIRAIHIFAIALRGLIRKVLKEQPSSMEENALGEVVFRMLAKEETCATFFVGTRHDSDKERTTLDVERSKKFKISHSEYVEKKRQLEAKNRDAMSSIQQSAEPRVERVGEGNQDFDVSWMVGGEEDDGPGADVEEMGMT